MKNIRTLTEAIDAEKNRHKLAMTRIKRFYKFWDTMVVDDGPRPRFKIKDKYYWATTIDTYSYRLILTPEHVGPTIEMTFNK